MEREIRKKLNFKNCLENWILIVSTDTNRLGAKATQNKNKIDGKRVKVKFSTVGRFTMLKMGRITEKRNRQVAGT